MGLMNNMTDENNYIEESIKEKAGGGVKNKKDYLLPSSILLAAIIIAGAWIYTTGLKNINNPPVNNTNTAGQTNAVNFEDEVLPPQGVILPVKWGNLGKQLVDAGAIDAKKFEEIYSQRGGLGEEDKKLLYGENNDNLKIDSKNSGLILNLFWAFGLTNKNSILEQGPMMDPRYGGAGTFASTGGWILAKGDAMNHYSKHSLVVLTPEQQKLVENVSKNIYRPCCGNSVYFPDCNHGMAMLGLLELMAAQGLNEQEMYNVALLVNSYWFPDTYLTIAKYFQNRGVQWSNINPKEVLGSAYSGALGYQQILKEVEPAQFQGGGGCGA